MNISHALDKTLIGIPAKNEAGQIGNTIQQIQRLFADADIHVFDDKSNDGTAGIAQALGASVHENLQERTGYGAMLHACFNEALMGEYDYLLTMDGDGQHAPEELTLFFEAATKTQADIYSGSRYLPNCSAIGHAPKFNRLVNACICRSIKEKFGISLTDSLCGMKLYRVKGLKNISMNLYGYLYPLEVLLCACTNGLSIIEIPIKRIYFNDVKPPRHYCADILNEIDYFMPIIGDKELQKYKAGLRKYMVHDKRA